MNRFINTVVFATLLFAGLMNTGCSEFEQPEPVSGPTLYQVAAENPDLNILFAAWRKTGLGTSFNNVNSGQFTIFAPHDSAFVVFFRATLNQPAWDEIDVINYINNTMSTTSTISLSAMTTRLNYHTFSSKVLASQITGGQVFTTLQGARLSISKTGTDVLLNANNPGTAAGNGAKVRTTNIEAANGVIHTINKVLNPVTTASVASFLGLSVSYATNPPTITGGTTSNTNNADFNLLAAALRKTQLVLVLVPNQTPLPDYTVFGPNDGVLRALINSIDNTVTTEAQALTFIDNLTGSQLTLFTDVLKYHVVAGRVLSTDLTNGQQPTTLLTGKKFTVNISGSTVTLTDGNASSPDATVIAANTLTNAGVFHAINQVLLPE